MIGRVFKHLFFHGDYLYSSTDQIGDKLKIAVLSDFHFGYAYSSELEDDPFDAVEEAFDRIDADMILILGDIFDSRLPKTATWAHALRVLSKPLLRENSNVKIVDSNKELKKISHRTLRHIPVIAIHGNHERRGRGELNTVQAMENAGLLIYLHAQYIVFEKDGKKVAIHGMGSVPERFAKDALNEWNPKPIDGCYNILVLHQNIDPYVYSPLEPPSLNLSNLPKGFDLILDGHVHTRNEQNIGSTRLVTTGSTVVTQFDKSEAENDKGFYSVDTNENRINFFALKNNRKFFYKEIDLRGSYLKNEIEFIIDEILAENTGKKPIIKIKIQANDSDFLSSDLRNIEAKYSDRAIMIFAKELESPEVLAKVEFLRNIREQKLSAEEIGLKILRNSLEALQFEDVFDSEQVFHLLDENEVDRVFSILLGEQRMLM
jgi:DNA repair exonuclease SbcCD nuclease subunit